jgi:hypothetical protein
MMKTLRNTLASVALAGLIVAQPALAAPVARTATPTADTEQMRGSGINAVTILGAFAVLLVLAELTSLIDVFDNDDNPTSP